MNYSKQVPAAERTLDLLEALAIAPQGLRAGELAEELRVSRSSLFALLNTLKARRYIEQRDSRGPYRLGRALWALIPGPRRNLASLVEAFQTDIELAGLSESLALVWLDGEETVIVAQLESKERLRVVFEPGERKAAYASAAGLVLLAGLPPNAVSTASREVNVSLQDIQKEGLAQSINDEIIEFAAPVCPDGARPVAALLLSVPAFRYRAEQAESLLRQLRQGAARLSYRLGAPGYQPYGWAAGESLGPTQSLSQAEIEQFLQGAWGARLACVRQDGRPHVVPLWYEWDGKYAWITAFPGAYWKDYVKESVQVSMTIDEPWPPLRRALIAGRAEPLADDNIPGGLAALRRRLAVRYLGPGAAVAAEFSQSEGWEAFRIAPDKITGYRGLGVENEPGD